MHSYCPSTVVYKKLREPYEYTASLPGKSLRSKLVDSFNEWIGASEGDKSIVIKVIETLHNASLMIDDIQDSSLQRRGQKCAYKVYGVPLTINSANLAYFEALKLLENIKNYPSNLVKSFTEEMIRLHEGQGMEIYFRDNDLKPTIDEYYVICSLKTGGLFRLSVKLLINSIPRLNDESTADLIICLAEKLGKFYQVRDDYLNIFKGPADDLIEGKFTLPTLFADFLTSLKGFKQEKEKVAETVKKLIELEADKFCRRTLGEMVEEIENFIFEIEQRTGRGNEELKEIIYSLIEKQ